MSKFPAEVQRIPFIVTDYPPELVDVNRPEVQHILLGCLGDRVLFENLIALRSILDIAERIGGVQVRQDPEINSLLTQRYDGIIERRRQLGDIERRQT